MKAQDKCVPWAFIACDTFTELLELFIGQRGCF